MNSQDLNLTSLRDATQGRIFTPDEAARILNLKKSSVYWLLHTWTEGGHLIRLARGFYAAAVNRPREKMTQSLSRLTEKAARLLRREGIHFYVTGLDILVPYFDQVPVSFPPLIYLEKGSSDWAQTSLADLEAPVLLNPKRDEISIARNIRPEIDPVILRETAEFGFVHETLASTEKAFVDLYYEITRGYYDFPLGDLAHMLVTCYHRGQLNPVKVIAAARRRRIDAEVRYLLDACFGAFNDYARPTIQLSQPVQQFIRTVRKLHSQRTNAQDR